MRRLFAILSWLAVLGLGTGCSEPAESRFLVDVTLEALAQEDFARLRSGYHFRVVQPGTQGEDATLQGLRVISDHSVDDFRDDHIGGMHPRLELDPRQGGVATDVALLCYRDASEEQLLGFARVALPVDAERIYDFIVSNSELRTVRNYVWRWRPTRLEPAPTALGLTLPEELEVNCDLLVEAASRPVAGWPLRGEWFASAGLSLYNPLENRVNLRCERETSATVTFVGEHGLSVVGATRGVAVTGAFETAAGLAVPPEGLALAPGGSQSVRVRGRSSSGRSFLFRADGQQEGIRTVPRFLTDSQGRQVRPGTDGSTFTLSAEALRQLDPARSQWSLSFRKLDTDPAAPTLLVNLVRVGLSSLAPLSGPFTGGTRVTLTGPELGAATSVRFGSQETAFTVTSPTTLVAVAPPGTGSVLVTVTTPHGPSNGLSYTYTVPPLSVSSEQGTGPLEPLTARQYQAQALLPDGTLQDVTAEAAWATSDPSVATVSAGLVRAVRPGSATISASYAGQTATAPVTVGTPELLLDLKLELDRPVIFPGITAAARVIGVFSTGPREVTSEATFTLDPPGSLRAERGRLQQTVTTLYRARVTAHVAGRATRPQELLVLPGPLTRLDIAPGPIVSLANLFSLKLTATGVMGGVSYPLNSLTEFISWESLAPHFVTVDADGQIYAPGPVGSLAFIEVKAPGSMTASGQALTDRVAVEVAGRPYNPPPPTPIPTPTPTPTPTPPPGRKLYVANQGSDTISVIDTGTNQVTTTIPLTVPGGSRLALNASGSRLLVKGNNGIAVVDTTTDQEVSVRNFAFGLLNLVADSALNRLFLTQNAGVDTLATLDEDTGNSLGPATTTNLDNPTSHGMAVDSTGTRLYLVGSTGVTAQLQQRDATQIPPPLVGAPSTVNFGATPTLNEAFLALNPAGTQGLVSYVSQVSLTSFTVPLTAAIQNGPADTKARRQVRYYGNTLAVVANETDGTLEQVSTAGAPAVLNAVALGAASAPFGVTVNPEGTRAYVTGRTTPGRVFVVDLTTTPPSLVTAVTVGDNPAGVVLRP